VGSEDGVSRSFAALEAGDIDTVRAIRGDAIINSRRQGSTEPELGIYLSSTSPRGSREAAQAGFGRLAVTFSNQSIT
jgi:hypothetical protein